MRQVILHTNTLLSNVRKLSTFFFRNKHKYKEEEKKFNTKTLHNFTQKLLKPINSAQKWETWNQLIICCDAKDKPTDRRIVHM